MNNKFKSIPVRPSEITPKDAYLSRRDFMKAAGVIAGSMALAACVPASGEESAPQVETAPTEIVDALTSLKDITSYTNYYEFSLDKKESSELAKNLTTEPWTVEVYGLVNKPQTFGVDDLLRLFPQEERIYRMRCVEAWSMVIPWNGFTLSSLLNEVEPTSDAKYVRFETIHRPEEMQGIKKLTNYPWPYQEGLRLDEAMHDLTLLATGIYGETILPQNGAPIRLVVPWKYGFKSIKSIVKIELTSELPATLWNTTSAREYGFYANVNPTVQHPRWSQVTERRIGELKRRETLMFNGYGEEVAHLYTGMELSKDF